MQLDDLLHQLAERGGSDLYVTVGTPPLIRVDGTVLPVECAPLDGAAIEALLQAALTAKDLEEFATNWELNTARIVAGAGRFRLSVFRQRGEPGLVARLIQTEIPTAESLQLPAILLELVNQKRGLVLVTGATGSGKSTTLAAMLDHRNRSTKGHILTVEDPIEFVHPHRNCVVTQREVGTDTATFAAALRAALRQAPDVLLIGEMRDLPTVEAALHFSETGHLVLGTLHANNADQAVERLLSFFPPVQHPVVLQQLSQNLRGIISQRLVPRIGGTGRVAAIEIMLNSPRIASLIAKGETTSLKSAIEFNATDGSQSFDQALFNLVKAGLVDGEEALRQADSANNLRLRMKADGAAEARDVPRFQIRGAEEWPAA